MSNLSGATGLWQIMDSSFGAYADQRRALWMLARQSGGTITLTEAEQADCPALPRLRLTRNPLTGSIIIEALSPTTTVKGTVVAGEELLAAQRTIVRGEIERGQPDERTADLPGPRRRPVDHPPR